MTARLLSQAIEVNPDIRVVGCAPGLDELVQELKQQEVDVMVVSAHLTDLLANRLSPLATVIDGFPEIPCILLMDRSMPETVVDGFRAGVKGVFCCAQGDTKQLEKCIQKVAEGQIWADTAQLHYLVSALPTFRISETRTKRANNGLLTPREDQVVRLVAEGMSNRDIASEMRLSENTVKNYLFKIFEKLGFSNRVELVLYATANPPLETGAADGVNSTPRMEPAT
jgi:DNA-binding NarL/FixJ family response regulator